MGSIGSSDQPTDYSQYKSALERIGSVVRDVWNVAQVADTSRDISDTVYAETNSELSKVKRRDNCSEEEKLANKQLVQDTCKANGIITGCNKNSYDRYRQLNRPKGGRERDVIITADVIRGFLSNNAACIAARLKAQTCFVTTDDTHRDELASTYSNRDKCLAELAKFGS